MSGSQYASLDRLRRHCTVIGGSGCQMPSAHFSQEGLRGSSLSASSRSAGSRAFFQRERVLVAIMLLPRRIIRTLIRSSQHDEGIERLREQRLPDIQYVLRRAIYGVANAGILSTLSYPFWETSYSLLVWLSLPSHGAFLCPPSP
jgi:hypothetical protein